MEGEGDEIKSKQASKRDRTLQLKINEWRLHKLSVYLQSMLRLDKSMGDNYCALYMMMTYFLTFPA